MVATMAVVLVKVVEKAMVVLDQNMVTKVVDRVAVVEDMMVTMKEEILEVTMVVVETIMISEITVDNSNQIMDPWKGVVLVEEARAVPAVMVLDLVVDVVDMVAEGSKNWEEKGYSS